MAFFQMQKVSTPRPNSRFVLVFCPSPIAGEDLKTISPDFLRFQITIFERLCSLLHLIADEPQTSAPPSPFDAPRFKFALSSFAWPSGEIAWSKPSIFLAKLKDFVVKSVSSRKGAAPKPAFDSNTFELAHSLLDSVPTDAQFDILWITDGAIHSSIEVDVYGVLMRSTKMHRATVTVITPERSPTLTPWLSLFSARLYHRAYQYNIPTDIDKTMLERRMPAVENDFRLLDIHTVWRGSLKFNMMTDQSSDATSEVRLSGITVALDPEFGALSRPLHAVSVSAATSSIKNLIEENQSEDNAAASLLSCDELAVLQVVPAKAVPKFLFSAKSYRVEFSTVQTDTAEFFRRFLDQGQNGAVGPSAFVVSPVWKRKPSFFDSNQWKDAAKSDNFPFESTNLFDLDDGEPAPAGRPLLLYTFGKTRVYMNQLALPLKELKIELFQNYSASFPLLPSHDELIQATRTTIARLANVPVYISGNQFVEEQSEIGFSEMMAIESLRANETKDITAVLRAATAAKQQKLSDRHRKYLAVDIRSPTKAHPRSNPSSTRASPAFPSFGPAAKRRKLTDEFVASSFTPDAATEEQFAPSDDVQGAAPLSLSRTFALVASQAEQDLLSPSDSVKKNPRQSALSLHYSPSSSQQSKVAEEGRATVCEDGEIEFAEQSDGDEEDEGDNLGSQQHHIGVGIYSPPRSAVKRRSLRRRPDDGMGDLNSGPEDDLVEHDLSEDAESGPEDTGSVIFDKLLLGPEKSDAALRVAQASLQLSRTSTLTKLDSDVRLFSEKIRSLERQQSRRAAYGDASEESSTPRLQRPSMSRSNSNSNKLDEILMSSSQASKLKRSGSLAQLPSSIPMPTQMALDSDILRAPAPDESSLLIKDRRIKATATPVPNRMSRAKTYHALSPDTNTMPAFDIQFSNQHSGPNRREEDRIIESSSQPLPSVRTSPRKHSSVANSDQTIEKQNLNLLWRIVYKKVLGDFKKDNPIFQDTAQKLYKICKYFLELHHTKMNVEIPYAELASAVDEHAGPLFKRARGGE